MLRERSSYIAISKCKQGLFLFGPYALYKNDKAVFESINMISKYWYPNKLLGTKDFEL